MATKKITDLVELISAASGDVLPIVDISDDITKKIQVNNLLASKQDTLVSGTNIKTLNSESLLGSGNIEITASPSGVGGAIQFSDGSAFSSDAANLFWDDTNNRLGVGTNVPSALLNVQNSTNQVLLARFKDAIDSTSYIDIKNDATLTDYTGLYFGTSRKIMSKQNGTLFISCDNNISFINGLGSVGAITPTEFQIGSISGARLGIKGSGTTFATNSLLVQNSAGTELFKVRDDGDVNIPDTAIIGALTLVSNKIIGTSIRLQPTSGYLSISKDASAAPANTIVYIKGSGTTAATTALLVQNSAGSTAFQVYDHLDTRVFGALAFNNGNTFILNTSNTLQIAAVNGATSDLHLNPNRQVNINNTGSYTAQVSAILQADSTTKGFLPPRMTTTQKNAISSPASGLMVYDTDTNKLCCYNGTSWNDLF
jgi:hypothetical protein